MGFLSDVLAWAVLAMGLGFPTIAILDAVALSDLTDLELKRNGMSEDERDVALRSMRRYLALGVCCVVVFGVACLLTRMGRGNAGMTLGVPCILLWRWASRHADRDADVARRAARAAAAARAADQVAP